MWLSGTGSYEAIKKHKAGPIYMFPCSMFFVDNDVVVALEKP